MNEGNHIVAVKVKVNVIERAIAIAQPPPMYVRNKQMEYVCMRMYAHLDVEIHVTISLGRGGVCCGSHIYFCPMCARGTAANNMCATVQCRLGVLGEEEEQEEDEMACIVIYIYINVYLRWIFFFCCFRHRLSLSLSLSLDLEGKKKYIHVSCYWQYQLAGGVFFWG